MKYTLIATLVLLLGAGCSGQAPQEEPQVNDNAESPTTEMASDTITDTSESEAIVSVDWFLGTWGLSGSDPKNIISWRKEWTFTEQDITLNAYPELNHYAGSYTVAGDSESTITLELHEQEGDLGVAPRTMVLELREDGFYIDSQGPYAALEMEQ